MAVRIVEIVVLGGRGDGGRTRANVFFGRSERPKNIGTDQFFGAHFPVALKATQQG